MKNNKKSKSTKSTKSVKNTKSIKSPKSPQSAKNEKSGGEIVVGVIDIASKGYGFLMVEGRERDIFIPASCLGGALSGDTAEVVITGARSGGGADGEVINIIKRAFTTLVGTYIQTKKSGFVIPDDKRKNFEILINQGAAKGAKHNDKVVVEITSYPQSGLGAGKITEVLGGQDEKGVDILSIVRAYNLYETFPSSVLKEADILPDTVLETEKKSREDFTHKLCVTIDGDDSKDFDDAVGLDFSGGNYTLYVHIADVAHYVKQGSRLDKEAFKRGTSVYMPSLVLPMLPKKISNGICSLNENEERLVLSVIMTIDKKGNVIKSDIKEGVIRSSHRLTYKITQSILDGDKENTQKFSDTAAMLFNMQDLAKILYRKRMDRGNIEFNLTESEIILDEKGKAVDIKKFERLITHRIIEEFMLIANETVAEKMHFEKSPFVYRSHEAPPAEKLQTLTDFLSAVGINFSHKAEVPTPKEVAVMLSGVDENLAAAVNRVALRSMSKATYEPVNKGHFGLAATYYCHFTAPIRRYPDLIIHRIIKDYLKNGKKNFEKYKQLTLEASTQSSERERLAEKAEREADDFKKAEYMQGKIGEEFDGVISGVTEWGVYVELDNSVEGLVRVEKLGGGQSEFSEKTMTLKTSKNSYRIGDKLKIKVDSVVESKINFILAV